MHQKRFHSSSANTMAQMPEDSDTQNQVPDRDIVKYISPLKHCSRVPVVCNDDVNNPKYHLAGSEFCRTSKSVWRSQITRRTRSASPAGCSYNPAHSGSCLKEMQGDNFESYNKYETCTGWENIPADIMTAVLKFLPTSSYRVIRATCHGWNKAIGSTIKYLKPDSLQNEDFTLRFPNVHTLDASCADTEVICSGSQVDLVSQVNDQNLSSIAHLQQLSVLYLTNCIQLQGSFLQYAGMIPRLRLLDLSGCSSLKNEYFIHFIPRCRRLESISLVGCEELDDTAVEAAISSLNFLTRFAVPPGTTDIGLGFLARSKSLRRLGFRSCHNITPQGLKLFLHKMPSIERVVVSKCHQITSTTLNRNISDLDHLNPGDGEGKYDLQNEQSDQFLQKLRRRSLNMELMMEYFYN